MNCFSSILYSTMWLGVIIIAFSATTAVGLSLAQSAPSRKAGLDEASLLRKTSGLTSHHKESDPKSAAWFGAFSQSESSYDEGAEPTDPQNPLYAVLDGWSPDTGSSAQGVPAEKFHESPSATYHDAWQTGYPSPTNGNTWYQGAGGSWNQAYQGYSKTASVKKSAEWFDSSVDQYDRFGRFKEPYAGTADRYWWAQDRIVNTTLECKDQGCVANSTLQAFDGTKDRALKCVMNLKVHATDFDSDSSQEVVEWIIVNGVQVKAPCMPGMNGCQKQQGEALYPCIEDLDITHLVPWQGTLNIAAKISDTVDECPYNGNLLSAVPVVSCLVISQNPSPMQGGMPNYQEVTGNSSSSSSSSSVTAYSDAAAASGYQDGSAAQSVVTGWKYGDASGNSVGDAAPSGLVPGMSIGDTTADGAPYYPFGDLSAAVSSYGAGADGDWSMDAAVAGQLGGADSTVSSMVGDNLYRAIAPLNCIEPGCQAFVKMQLNTTAVQFGKCTVSVFVNQTDFDGSQSVEMIEYIGTEDKNFSTDLKPGKNPCQAADSGSPMNPADMVYTAVNNADITDSCTDGYLELIAKISPDVDDCASNGYLLNAIAQVDCTVSNAALSSTANTGLLQEDARTLTRLRGGQ